MYPHNIKILIGVPEISHREIATYEVDGLKKLGFNVKTTLYGSVKGRKSILRLLIIFKNAISIIKIVRKGNIDLVYINTAFNKQGLIRDFLSLLILRLINPKIVLKYHGSDGPLLQSKNIIYKLRVLYFMLLLHWFFAELSLNFRITDRVVNYTLRYNIKLY